MYDSMIDRLYDRSKTNNCNFGIKFANHQISPLASKQKTFIIDAFRGNQKINHARKINSSLNKPSISRSSSESDELIANETSYMLTRFAKYNKKEGSWYTKAIVDVLTKNGHKGIPLVLTQSQINKQLMKNTGKQTCEIISRLQKSIILKPNSKTNANMH